MAAQERVGKCPAFAYEAQQTGKAAQDKDERAVKSNGICVECIIHARTIRTIPQNRITTFIFHLENSVPIAESMLFRDPNIYRQLIDPGCIISKMQ